MEPTLQAKHITKTFPGVKALTDVSVDFYPGEVHALLGENGAGKSTLIKILSGVYTPTEGEVWMDGHKVEFNVPSDAMDAKIAVIHQELSIAPDLTVAENIFLGVEPKKPNGLLDRAKMNSVSQQILDDMGVGDRIKATDFARDLTAAQQQMAEIAKGINKNARVVVMDEPTSFLDINYKLALLRIIRALSDKGITVNAFAPCFVGTELSLQALKNFSSDGTCFLEAMSEGCIIAILPEPLQSFLRLNIEMST